MITVPFSRGSQSLMVCMCALPRLSVTFSSLPRRDEWTSVFGNATKMKTGAVYLVNNKHSAGFTPDLCTCLRASLPPPLSFLRCVGCVSPLIPVSNPPICFCVNCTPLSCGLFHFFFPLKGAADKVINVIPPADRRLLRINQHSFQGANWLI